MSRLERSDEANGTTRILIHTSKKRQPFVPRFPWDTISRQHPAYRRALAVIRVCRLMDAIHAEIGDQDKVRDFILDPLESIMATLNDAPLKQPQPSDT